MPVTFPISDEVRAILGQAIIDETSVTLTCGQLDRKLYEAVNKALVAAGGKWNRKTGAHIFPRDPRSALGLAIETGVATHEQQAKQAFYTPHWLAEEIVRDYMHIEPGDTVLEPSAGYGALALAASSYVAKRSDIRCYETDPLTIAALREHGFDAHEANFLDVLPLAVYDHVVMNPPFAKGQDITHVLHAVKFLKPGGQLVALMSAGVEYNQSKKHKAFRAMLATMDAEITALPDKAFHEAGTDVRTVLVSIRKTLLD